MKSSRRRASTETRRRTEAASTRTESRGPAGRKWSENENERKEKVRVGSCKGGKEMEYSDERRGSTKLLQAYAVARVHTHIGWSRSNRRGR